MPIYPIQLMLDSKRIDRFTRLQTTFPGRIIRLLYSNQIETLDGFTLAELQTVQDIVTDIDLVNAMAPTTSAVIALRTLNKITVPPNAVTL